MPVRIGTCSWKYPSWEGLVYSRASGIDYLEEYARRFSTVELPNALTLTHSYRKKGETAPRPNPQFLSPELFADVIARLSPLSKKIGAVMLQFEYLNAGKMGSLRDFISKLAVFFDAASPAVPCAVELRNPAWLGEHWFRFLAERRLGHVFLQGYFMPSIVELYRRFKGLLHNDVVARTGSLLPATPSSRGSWRWSTT